MSACVAEARGSWTDVSAFLEEVNRSRDAESARRGRKATESLSDVPVGSLYEIRRLVKELCDAIGDVVSPNETDKDRDKAEELEYVEQTVHMLSNILIVLQGNLEKFELQGQLDEIVKSLDTLVVSPLIFAERMAFSEEWMNALGGENYARFCKLVVQKLATGGSLKLIDCLVATLRNEKGQVIPKDLPPEVVVQVWDCLLRIGIKASTSEHMRGPLKSYFIINFAWSKLAWLHELQVCNFMHPVWNQNTEYNIHDVFDVLCNRVSDSYRKLLQEHNAERMDEDTSTSSSDVLSEQKLQKFSNGLKMVRFWVQHLCKFAEHNGKMLFGSGVCWQSLLNLMQEMVLLGLDLHSELAFLVQTNLLVNLHKSARFALHSQNDVSSLLDMTETLLRGFDKGNEGRNSDVGMPYSVLVTVCGVLSPRNSVEGVLKLIGARFRLLVKTVNSCIPLLLDNKFGMVVPQDGSNSLGLVEFLSEFILGILLLEGAKGGAIEQAVGLWKSFELHAMQCILSIDPIVHHIFSAPLLKICHTLDGDLLFSLCNALWVILHTVAHECQSARCISPVMERVASLMVNLVELSDDFRVQEKVSKCLMNSLAEHGASHGQLIFLTVILEAQERMKADRLVVPIAELDHFAVEVLNVLEAYKVVDKLDGDGLLLVARCFRFLRTAGMHSQESKWLGRARLVAKNCFAELLPKTSSGTLVVECYSEVLEFLVCTWGDDSLTYILTHCQLIWDQQWCAYSEKARLAILLVGLVNRKSKVALPPAVWQFIFSVDEPLVAHLAMTAFVQFSRSPAAYGIDLRTLLPNNGMPYHSHCKSAPMDGDFHLSVKEYLSHSMENFNLDNAVEREAVRRDLKCLWEASHLSQAKQESYSRSMEDLLNATIHHLQAIEARMKSNPDLPTTDLSAIREQLSRTKCAIEHFERCV